ncbi:flagellar hook-associated protein 2 [Limnobacter thiooxidans]|uniref:Flagellar hook-associated protein 2 n=1 Tax=Limnobacter thiooxidans TaxID=131080 RepID=A0AA86IY42_9BURK|nr:flagellar hook-associated protein 2 [Limnobacter thiooxidans]BET25532.1 flagellar filament capping protein FliD [Limnobacter thiooxidans]
MPSISSAGIGSGLDIEGIISSLMAAERLPLNKVSTERTAINTKISIYGIIKNSFADLKTATDKLTNLSNLNPLKATSTDDKVVSATASSANAKGSYSIEVSQLAKAQSVATLGVATADTVVGTGSLTITLGSYDSNTNTFTDNADKTPVTINIGAGQQTLEGVRQAINEANAGVNASIVNDGAGSRLVLTSKDTGAVNGFKLEVADDDGNNTNVAGLSRLAYDPTALAGSGKNADTLQAAQNANFTINNLPVSKASNTVSDAVEGLTLNLKAVTTTPINLEVGLDDAALKTTLDGFVTAYNKIRGNLKDQQQKDATLSKETTPSSLERGLRNILREQVAQYGIGLSDIGLSFDKDGVLSLNKSKLDTAVAADPAILEKVFSNTATTTDARVKFLGATSKTLEGTYAINVSNAYNGSNTIAGTINGVAATGVSSTLSGAVGDASEGLQFSVAQDASGNMGSITFSKGLAERLSDWINTLSDEGGALSSRTDGLNSRKLRLDDQEDRLNLRLEQVEKRYRAQFSALDSMLASMQQTSSYLSQQLAALSR